MLAVGNEMEQKLMERKDDGTPVHTVRSLLHEETVAKPEPSNPYKPFMGNVPIKRIKIPESGVW